MKWTIFDGPQNVEPDGFDATFWRWFLRDGAGLPARVLVKISGTAMATDGEYLSAEVRSGRETHGQTEIEKVLDWWQPPRVIEMGTSGIVTAGGTSGEPKEEDEEAARRIEEIREWLKEMQRSLSFHRHAALWIAMAVPTIRP